MKKLISFLLVLSMITSMFVTVSSVEIEEPGVYVPEEETQTSANAATSSDGYVWPIDVNTNYCKYTGDFSLTSSYYHPGIDISANTGTPIVAAKGGTVYCASTASADSGVECSRCGFWDAGYHVVIKQSDGKYTMYAHMSKVSVTTGESISTGKKIGEVGNTGNSGGAHLHFEIHNANSDGSINYNSFVEPLEALTPFCNVYANSITNTSAILHGQFGTLSLPFSSAGIYFGTSTTNMEKIVDEEAYGIGYPHDYTELFFETSEYCGQLEKDVAYYYQIWIVNDGKEYKSDIYSFTAGDENSSAQVTDKASYSLSWTDGMNEISETNAKVGKICNLDGINNLSVSKVGIYLYDNNDSLLASLTESTANAGFVGESVVHIWYDINNELNYSLTSGTTYKYKLMVEIDGKTHYSPVYTFTTEGSEHNYVYIGGVPATGSEGGTVTGAGEYELGASVTLTATPDEGYIFEGWYENDELVSSDATITFTAEANRDLIAKFVKIISADSPQLIMGSSETWAGKEVTVTLLIKNNPGVAGLLVSLGYDESVLTLKDTKRGDLFSGFSVAKNFAWDESYDVVEDGILATFTFAVAEDAEVGDYSIEVIIRSCTNENLDDVELTSVSGTISVIDFVYGDANGDAQIDMKDVVIMRKYITNFDYDTNTSPVNVGYGADANGDGKIDMKDVVILRKYITNYDYDTDSSTVVLGPQQ